jgi:hypothetical protein
MTLPWCSDFSSLSPNSVKPRLDRTLAGFCDLMPGLTMVVVKKRALFNKSKRHPEKEHDFSRDEVCAKCGMARQVWDDTRVPCPGEPYNVASLKADKAIRRWGPR